jgi:hypothetical protein
MSNEINSANDYRAIVADYAEIVATEAMEQAENDRSEAEELINDTLLHQTVDGSEYIIYYRHHLPIIQYSDNESYMIENFGEESAGHALSEGGIDQLHTAIAFWAFYADISDRLPEVLDAMEEEATEED